MTVRACLCKAAVLSGFSPTVSCSAQAVHRTVGVYKGLPDHQLCHSSGAVDQKACHRACTWHSAGRHRLTERSRSKASWLSLPLATSSSQTWPAGRQAHLLSPDLPACQVTGVLALSFQGSWKVPHRSESLASPAPRWRIVPGWKPSGAGIPPKSYTSSRTRQLPGPHELLCDRHQRLQGHRAVPGADEALALAQQPACKGQVLTRGSGKVSWYRRAVGAVQQPALARVLV